MKTPNYSETCLPFLQKVNSGVNLIFNSLMYDHAINSMGNKAVWITVTSSHACQSRYPTSDGP